MVRTTTVYTCDVCKKEMTDPAQIKQQYSLPVIFHSETTEGRPTEPHVGWHKADVCLDCLMRSINIHAVGAQGVYDYWFGGDGDAV